MSAVDPTTRRERLIERAIAERWTVTEGTGIAGGTRFIYPPASWTYFWLPDDKFCEESQFNQLELMLDSVAAIFKAGQADTVEQCAQIVEGLHGAGPFHVIHRDLAVAAIRAFKPFQTEEN